jgi:hypothetical protein
LDIEKKLVGLLDYTIWVKVSGMNRSPGKLFDSAVVCIFLLHLGFAFPANGTAETAPPPARKTLNIAVVGDTGIGERGFNLGYRAVMREVEGERPDIFLHLGDFIYQDEFFPQACREDFIREVRETLVVPYRFRLFVPGDNDFPPQKDKPMASGCWERIDPLDTPFDPVPDGETRPGRYEGVKTIGSVLFAILDSGHWRDPTPWLKPRIEQARENGLWVIIAVHEPAVTTAWYLDKRDRELGQIKALRPDLVFSGNQHSYERFHPGLRPAPSSRYRRGAGAIHIVSGGGGATIKPFADWQAGKDCAAPFKPFADLQGEKDHVAPPAVCASLAKRALMNHYVILEVSSAAIRGKTYRVCPGEDEAGRQDPRWKPENKMWKTIPLSCDGLPPGTDLFDEFEITSADTPANRRVSQP